MSAVVFPAEQLVWAALVAVPVAVVALVVSARNARRDQGKEGDDD
jgi:hypothetical protein